MKQKQNLVMIVLAVIAGFFGGFISNQIFSTKSVFAQPDPKANRVVSAEAFKLVSRSGREIGYFGLAPSAVNYGQIQLRLGGQRHNGIVLTANPMGGMISITGEDYGQSFVTGGDGSEITLFGKKPNSTPNLRLTHSVGKTSIGLKDKNGIERVSIGNVELVQTKTDAEEKQPLSSIVLYDEKGSVLWSAP